jgi:hypothetical protein
MDSKQLCAWLLILGLVTPVVGKEVSTTSSNAVRQAPRALNGKERNIGRQIANIEFQDVAGKSYQLSDFANRKALVIAVTSTSCPLSKKYLPTIVRLAARYRAEGVAFLLINPVATDKPASIQSAASELSDDGIYVHDREGRISQALGLTSTTDALLLDPARTVHYQGAIDDQYGFGYSLDAPRKNYLISALDEFLRSQPVIVAATEAPGCHLTLDSEMSLGQSVTYHNRVSRIIQTNCGECHRDGGVGPFSLETYADVLAHAKMIETVVSRGTMPPWFAASSESAKFSPWINDCSLSAADKQQLLDWIKSDKPEGDPKDAVLPVSYPSGWTIGQPDLIAKFPSPIPIKATGTMPYQNVVVETALNEDRWVQAIEVRPGSPEVVHHILVFVRPPRDEEGHRKNSPSDEINYWGIYVPGNSKQVYAEGFARKLPKGSRIRFQMHYTPSGKATEDLTQVGFVFANKAPEYEVKTASLVNAWFEIPPGASQFQDSAKFKLSSDVTVMGYLPHMHLRGKACSFEAISPDGKREMLLDIPRYDFNWQLLYRYSEPRTFTKGTVLKFNAIFDNSQDNPANPDPKATVRWGEQTNDEMIVGYLEYYVPVGSQANELSEIERNQFGLAEDRDAMLFSSLDANDDDKLSLEELKKITENPRMKQVNPLMVAAVFKTLDKNQDSSLSVDEFRHLRELFRKKK